jgi:hypothetical protein
MTSYVLKCFLGLIYLTGFSVIACADWVQDVDTSNANGSLNIDPSKGAGGPPAITFNNEVAYVTWFETNGSAYLVYVKHLSGTTWVQDGGPLNVNTSQHASGPQIAFTGNIPYVTWCESIGATHRVYVKSFNGTAWSSGTSLNKNASKDAICPSIAAYGSTPYVAWRERDASNIDQVYVKHFNGSSWIQDGTGSLNVNSSLWVSAGPYIAMAGATPYVSWSEGGGANLYVKHCVGGFWNLDGGGSVSTQAFNGHGLTVFNSTPYIVYSTHEFGDCLQIKKLDTGSWVQVGDTLPLSLVPQISFAGTTPYIAFRRNVSVDTVFVQHLVVDHWVQDGTGLNIDPTRYASYPKIAVNGSTPYITWYEDFGAPGLQQQIYVKHLVGIIPTLSLISPNHGLAGGTVNIKLVGPNFVSPFVVKLVRSGGTEEIAATSSVLTKPTLISATFDLASAVAGFYDIKVESNNQQDSLKRSFLVLSARPQQFNWVVQDLIKLTTPSLGGKLGGLAIGDGDNDGLQEIYAANRNQNIFKVRKLNDSWPITSLPTGSFGEYYDDIAVLDGNSDSSVEVYGGTYDNHIYQFSGASWAKGDLGTATDKIYTLANGDGNNDGWPEIYGGSADGHVYQFQKLNTWTKTDLGSTGSPIYSVAVGDGDGDNNFEVYAACPDHNLYQFKYNGVSWAKTIVGAGLGEMYTVVTGDANHDGGREVYSTNEDGKLYQFKWQVTSWAKSEIAVLPGKAYGLVFNDGENIGTDELFVACDDGHAYQVKYETNQWTKYDLGTASTPLYRLAIGDADNDNQHEIYALGDNNHVYQFKAGALQPTPTPTPAPILTPTPAPDFQGRVIDPKYFYVYPNPTHGVNVKFRFFLPQSADVRIKIFTTTDKFVWETGTRNYPAGWSELVWNASGMCNGVYFYLGEAWNDNGKEKVVKKLVLLK